MIRTRRLIGVGVAACAALLSLPSAGHAFSATYIDDAGVPQPLQPAGVTIRNMQTQITPSFAADEGRYSISITGPGGVATTAVPTQCVRSTFATPERVPYRGNGEYTVTVSTYKDATGSCSGTPQTLTYKFVINAFVALAPPAQGTVLPTRAKNTPGPAEYQLGVNANPGSQYTYVYFAPGTPFNPDGTVRADAERIQASSTQPGLTTPALFTKPGDYAFTAVSSFGDGTGDYSTAFVNPPVVLKLRDPFDFLVAPTVSYRKNDRWVTKGTLRTEFAAGKITLQAKRKGAKKFRKLATGKIKLGKGTNLSTFRMKFKQTKAGRYTLRYVYGGNKLVFKGHVDIKGRFRTYRF